MNRINYLVLSVEEECKSNKRFFRRLNNSEDDELIKNYKLLKLMESVEDENQNNLIKIQNNHLYNFTLSCIKGNKSESNLYIIILHYTTRLHISLYLNIYIFIYI